MRKRCSQHQCTINTVVECFRTVTIGTYFRDSMSSGNTTVSTGRKPVPEPTDFGTGPQAGQGGSSRRARTPSTWEVVLPSGTWAKVSDTVRRVAAISRRACGSRPANLSSNGGGGIWLVRGIEGPKRPNHRMRGCTGPEMSDMPYDELIIPVSFSWPLAFALHSLGVKA
jgi:hypothetical protein